MRTHKYIKKIGTGKNARYIYKNNSNKKEAVPRPKPNEYDSDWMINTMRHITNSEYKWSPKGYYIHKKTGFKVGGEDDKDYHIKRAMKLLRLEGKKKNFRNISAKLAENYKKLAKEAEIQAKAHEQYLKEQAEKKKQYEEKSKILSKLKDYGFANQYKNGKMPFKRADDEVEERISSHLYRVYSIKGNYKYLVDTSG